MKNLDFSYASVCSNDRVPSQHLASPFIEELEYIRCSNSYGTHIVTGDFTWLQEIALFYRLDT